MKVDSWTWDPIVVCWCGTGVLDNAEARRLHGNAWHTEREPAIYQVPAASRTGSPPA